LLSLGDEAMKEIGRVIIDSSGKSYNLFFFLELGKIVANSTNDSEDGSLKRCLGLGFSLNSDGADEQSFFSRRLNRGRGNSNSHPDALLGSFNFVLSLGGEVGSSCILLETARVMQVSGENADDEILVICAGKMKASNEVVDNRMDLSTSLIPVILFVFNEHKQTFRSARRSIYFYEKGHSVILTRGGRRQKEEVKITITPNHN
jgi:hypothetical protein